MTRIFLLGYMGAGKTTLGKAFARKTGRSFIDLVWYIEERFHKTIGELFTERGECGFRELEAAMLREVGAFEDVIISTGGGTPCFFDNMEYMNRQGVSVFLSVSPEVLFKRLSAATHSRPILQGKTSDELYCFIVEKVGERMSYYSRAHYTFNADNLENRWQIEEAVLRLEELLGDANQLNDNP